jgi:hypothetical protein
MIYPEYVNQTVQIVNPHTTAQAVLSAGFHYAQITVSNAANNARTFTVKPVNASVEGDGLNAKGVNISANQGPISELWTGANGTYLGLPIPANGGSGVAKRTYILGPFAADALNVLQSANDANVSYEVTLFNA